MANIFIGTYDGNIISISTQDYVHWTNQFFFKASQTYVSALSAYKNILISSGFDETIHIFDTKAKKQVAMLAAPDSTITALQLIDAEYIISASEGRSILIWKFKGLEMLHEMKGHKDKIISMSLHPSHKILLTIDPHKLLVWDIIKGCKKFSMKFSKQQLKVVKFLNDEQFIILSYSKLTIYSINNDKHQAAIDIDSQINDVCSDGKTIFMGSSPGIYTIDYDEKGFVGDKNTIKITNRIKSINSIKHGEKIYICCGSSNGQICVWEKSELMSNSKPILNVETHKQLCSMIVQQLKPKKSMKRVKPDK